MKKYLLGAAAALAVAAPGVASAQQTGYVDLGYSSTEIDVLGLSADGDAWTVGGATSWGGNGSFGGQFDGVFSSTDGDGGDATSLNAGVHLFTRSTNSLIGGFVNYGSTDADAGGDFDYWTIGLEGQWYMDRTTFDGALSYSEADDVDAEVTALDLGVTQFLTDNFSLNAGIGFGSLEVTGGDADLNTYGVGAEYQFAAMPISVFGGWTHGEIDDVDVETDTLNVGVRYNWGGSLLERNRSGASLARTGLLGRFAGAF